MQIFIDTANIKQIKEAASHESAHGEIRNLDQGDGAYSGSKFGDRGDESDEHQTDPYPAQACPLRYNIPISG